MLSNVFKIWTISKVIEDQIEKPKICFLTRQNIMFSIIFGKIEIDSDCSLT